MDIERVLRSTPATLTVTFYGDESPVDADGAVTVTITKADGTSLETGTASHAGAVGSGQYTYDLDGQANLNVLSVDWAGTFSAVPATITTSVEIVGGFYFTIAELRASDSVLADTAKYPLAKLIEKRDEVEAEFEEYCEQAFVPRFHRETVRGDGTNSVYVSKTGISKVLAVNGVAPTAEFRQDGNALEIVDDYWVNGTYYTIEYEYGMASPPITLKQAALKRARGLLVGQRARIDERATLMQVPDFGTFHLSTPGKDTPTGVPAIDVVLNRYRLGGWGIA